LARERDALRKSVDDLAKITAELEPTRQVLEDTNRQRDQQHEIARALTQEKETLQEQLDRLSPRNAVLAKPAARSRTPLRALDKIRHMVSVFFTPIDAPN